jgi:hypothetical protein
MSDEGKLQLEFSDLYGAQLTVMSWDSENSEIPIPICDKCNDGYMTCLISRNRQVWMCSCGVQ